MPWRAFSKMGGSRESGVSQEQMQARVSRPSSSDYYEINETGARQRPAVNPQNPKTNYRVAENRLEL